MATLGYFLLNVAQALFLASWSVFWISAALVVSIFSSELPLTMARTCWAPALLWAGTARVKRRRVPGPGALVGPHVFVMNHQSMLDVPLAFSTIPLNLRFVAKQILKSIPFLGWYMWRTRMVFVDRRDRDQAIGSLSRAAKRIGDGASILAFPEGTRSTAGEILPFKKGPFVLAIEAGVPVVPVVVHGSHDVLPRGGFRLRPGPVHIDIGAPIPTRGLSGSDVETLMRNVRDAMIDMHLAMGGPASDREHAIAITGHQGIGHGRAADGNRTPAAVPGARA